MKPISVHGAKKGEPFSVSVSEPQTINELIAALQVLADMGHGATRIMRADSDAIYPFEIQSLQLYDTTKEQQEGEIDAPMIFLLC